MESVVLRCGACGAAIRIRPAGRLCNGRCPACLARARGHGPEAPADDSSRVGPGAIARRPGLRFPAVTLTLLLVPTIWLAPDPGSDDDGLPGSPPPSRATTDPHRTTSVQDSASDRSVPAAIPPATSPSPVAPHATPPPIAIRTAAARHEEPTRPSSPAPPPAAPQTPIPATPGPARTETASGAGATPGRFRVSDQDGRPLVARLHGQHDGKTVLMLPDGQLGIPNMLVPTDEPFRPLSAEELRPRVERTLSPDFLLFRTAHYLIFYKSNHEFAESSGKLLEDLYDRLLGAFRKHDLPVHDSEFPLVAVIYPTEKEFRASHPVDREVQAFYEIVSNRIYFYDKSDRDAHAPEVSALRKPQTVAHEGTHQILQNIGIHPRLSQWPIWLIEGLAEYCATPACTRKGGRPTWDGLGMINGLHLATIRELDDPVSLSVLGPGADARALAREPGKPLVEVLVGRSKLTPTEYALAWAMTHYLAFKRQDDFVAYLRQMSQLPPLVPRSSEEHLSDFRKLFGQDLARLDRSIDAYLKKLAKQRGYDPMPFYAVMFEQSLPAGLFRRAAMVSQSPQMIQQWVQDISNPQGAPPSWQALPHGTRARAVLAIESWMRGM